MELRENSNPRGTTMLQSIVIRMDERQSKFLYTFAIVSILNAYAVAQLVLM